MFDEGAGRAAARANAGREGRMRAVGDGGDRRPALRGSGDLRLAIVIDPTLPIGLLANTVGAIAIGLGAGQPGLGGVDLADLNGDQAACSADRPVPILQANPATMGNLLTKARARQSGDDLVVFPAFARTLHDFDDYLAAYPERDLRQEKIDGIGFCGASKWVKSLTGSLRLLR